MALTAGSLLKEARESRGLTLEDAAAATRVRVPYLEALEADEPSRLPAPVYARGYLRAYASLLELEAEPLVASLRQAKREPDRTVRPDRPRGVPAWRPVLTPGLILATAVALLGGAFVLYARHEISLERLGATRPAPVLIASPAPASAPASPAAAAHTAPSPAPAGTGTAVASPAAEVAPGHGGSGTATGEVSVRLLFTDSVWAYVLVDGQPVYGSSGRFFSAGDTATFRGARVTVTTGKGAATLVSVDGRGQGQLPDGVTTRDYTAQT